MWGMKFRGSGRRSGGRGREIVGWTFYGSVGVPKNAEMKKRLRSDEK